MQFRLAIPRCHIRVAAAPVMQRHIRRKEIVLGIIAVGLHELDDSDVDAGVQHQDCFDLMQFQALPLQLDLKVTAALVHQQPSLVVMAHVPGPEDQARHFRVSDQCRRRHGRTVKVALEDARAANIQHP